ncbi:phosphatidylethanolamine-binding protein 4 [Discoglossus pictus]
MYRGESALRMNGLWFILGTLLSLVFLSSTTRTECDYKSLLGEDADFCSGELHVVYPDMGDASCLYIPNCYSYPESLSKVWGPPKIFFTKAQEGQKYTLIMVDPDAPSRSDPVNRFWRHWVVTDIPGQGLLTGGILNGKIESEYRRPNPPPQTGYHRYQFLLYLQPPGSSPSLLPKEKHSFGAWDVNAFVSRTDLGSPLATTQLMTKNPKQ